MQFAPESQKDQIIAATVAETGISEELIETLVTAFYARIRSDALLGPIFADHIDDWGPHLARMTAFWSSVALMSGRYHGNPMIKHLPLPINRSHFQHWLCLFEATVQDVCPPQAQAHFMQRARRIAQSLSFGIEARSGGLPSQLR